MIGFRLINLLVPGDPDLLMLGATSGTWQFQKEQGYLDARTGILNGQCGITYSIEHPASLAVDGSAKCDDVVSEMAPLLLGASYLTGLSVTSDRTLPDSDVSILQSGSHWPRERAMGLGRPIVSGDRDFETKLSGFLRAWPHAGHTHKILLLVHHWLDALACWSFEDLYLSATTLLQVISATEADRQQAKLTYFQGVTDASRRIGIRALGRDFKDMRNNLVHEGGLLGGKFAGSGINDCAAVAADVLNWFDEYIHSVLSLGPPQRQRYSSAELTSLNSYSIPWP